MKECVIYGFVRNEGSVVVFNGTLVEDGTDVYVAIDHRPAADIARALDYEDPLVEIEDWQILGKIPVPKGLTAIRQSDNLRLR